MKIIKLRIQNINSIYGTWEIDFTDEAYLNSPLFAIIGKTGSGKSSILDAICFALYDQTDRMGEKRAAFASFNTTECMAELEFELNGILFFCHSAMSSNSKTGLFQNSLTSSWIQWEENGVVQKVEGTSRKTAKVQEFLGLSFEQFRQVILLAQGKFNAFLKEENKADSDNRAKILEKITGTEIYSRIGKKISERAKSSIESSNLLAAQLSSIDCLPQDEENKNRQRLIEIGNEEAENSTQSKTLENHLASWRKKEDCEKKLMNLLQSEDDLTTDEKAFEPEQPKLEAGRTAAKATEAFTAFETVRQAQEHAQAELTEAQQSLPALQSALNKASKSAEESIQAWQEATTHQEEREIALGKIDFMDSDIARLAKECKASGDKCQTLQNDIGSFKTEIQKVEASIEQLLPNKLQAENYLKEHFKDADLESKQAGWEAMISSLAKTNNELSKRHEFLTTEQGKLAEIQSKSEETAKELAEKNDVLEKAKQTKKEADDRLAAALGGFSLEKLKSAQDEQTKIVSILTALNPREVLKTFQEGAPCPVCGSLHHPYRSLDTEESPELTAAMVALKACRKHYENALNASTAVTQAQEKLTKAEGERNTVQAMASAAASALTEKQSAIHTEETDYENKNTQFLQDSQALQADFAFYGFVWKSGDLLPAAVFERKKNYAKRRAIVDDFEKNQSSLQQILAKLQGELNGKQTSLDDESSLHQNLLEKKENLCSKRAEEYQDKKTADERDALKAAVASTLKTKEANAAIFVAANSAVTAKKESIQSLTTQIAQSDISLQQRQNDLNTILKETGLMTIQKYTESLLSQKILDNLVQKETELKARRVHLKQSRQTLNEDLKTARSSLPDNFDPSHAELELAQLQQTSKALATERGRIEQILQSNEENKAKALELQKRLEENKAEWNRWKQLDSWIGNDRFRTIAQEYTFDVLLAKANDQLKNMLNGRYQMCSHADGGKLEIDVADTLLGGDIRTSKNLSGGEQFIISLALALGLANMVGQKFQIDSLFLDEGFGTLDGNELEEAMNTLAQLKNQGKLVGIITHAERLQERIKTRITLDKNGNGRSTLEGPGIRHLATPQIFVSPEEKKRRKKQEKEEKKQAKLAREK